MPAPAVKELAGQRSRSYKSIVNLTVVALGLLCFFLFVFCLAQPLKAATCLAECHK